MELDLRHLFLRLGCMGMELLTGMMDRLIYVNYGVLG